jgi:hypothetical protein
MSPRSRKKRRSTAQPQRPRWTFWQKGFGYCLLTVGFLTLLIYVFQSVEIKNVAYVMGDLMSSKQALLDEKHQLELALLEQQSFVNIEQALESQGLPLDPGPRLEIVLAEPAIALPVESGDSEHEDRLRYWLGRLNEAQAMMTTRGRSLSVWKKREIGGRGRKTQALPVNGKT